MYVTPKIFGVGFQIVRHIRCVLVPDRGLRGKVVYDVGNTFVLLFNWLNVLYPIRK